MAKGVARLTIGQVARRTGLAVSAIRFYEERGLVAPLRNAGGQRRFLASDIRRLSFMLIAQQLGFSLEEIIDSLKGLPEGRTPTKRDWTGISQSFRRVLQERIDIMTRMQERLDGCIGCGCLSLTTCALYNPEDRANRFGAGPRYLLGDLPDA
jgi:MerR family redox-sensitive transcriptional activator SoxR